MDTTIACEKCSKTERLLPLYLIEQPRFHQTQAEAIADTMKLDSVAFDEAFYITISVYFLLNGRNDYAGFFLLRLVPV